MINKEFFNIENLKDNSNESQISTNRLENFVNVLENGMSNWLKEFNWNKDELLQTNHEQIKYFDCPFDPGHTNILEKNYEKHIKKCKLKHFSMTDQDFTDYNKQPDVYSPFQVIINKETQNDILKNVQENKQISNLLPIPFQYDRNNYRDQNIKVQKPKNRDVSLTTNHLFVNFTPTERLMLHEYALNKSKSLGYQNSFENQEVAHLEESSLTESKASSSYSIEKKRRPKSYRTGKSKTHTEAIKELIDAQMDFLRKSNENKQEDNLNINQKREHSKSRSRSRSIEGLYSKSSSSKKKKKKSKI